MWLFWFTPLLLTALLWRLSALSLHGIRHEELAESVRNVFWLDQGLTYDGIYSNVGWYGTLLLVYKVFGFSLSTAKIVRLVIHLVGLYATASLLVRHLRPGAALVPLAAIGLSPALLYFGTTQLSFGLDVPYAAMCLWLLLSVTPLSRSRLDLAKWCLAGIIAMVAAMSYPAFVLYLPSLLIVAWWRLGQAGSTPATGRWPALAIHAASAAVGFALPLAAALLYVVSPELLIYDPVNQAGLFRGGGRFGFDPAALWRSITIVWRDLFVYGGSYYFDVSRPDFSGVLAPLGLATTAGLMLYLGATGRIDRRPGVAILVAVLMGLVVPNLGVDGEPGLRRSTILLSAVFASFAVVWHSLVTNRAGLGRSRAVAIALLALVPLSHPIKLPALADDLSRQNIYQNVDWFRVAGTPAASLARVLEGLDAGQQLACPMGKDGRVTLCRYQEIYAAVAGYRTWNGLPTPDIHALDWRTGEDIVLSPALWRDGYYPTCSRPDICERDIAAIFETIAQQAAKRGTHSLIR